MLFSFFSKEPRPFRTGYLPEQDGHEVYYHEFGNPGGEAVLAFHGGPGSFSKPKHAQLFDLRKYRVILFDQRGCGQSRAVARLENNTAPDLVLDAGRLLDTLGLTQAHIYGASWGSTLALLFAEMFPQKTKSLMVAKTFLARQKDINWISEDTARLYPDLMDRIAKDIPRGISLRKYYAKQMTSPLEADRIRATQLYGSYERMIGQLAPDFSDAPPSPEHMEAFALYMHYDAIDYGLKENQILENIRKIPDVPTLIVHNRLDLVCPVEQSYELSRTISHSRLVIVPDSGHSSDLLDRTIKKEISVFLSRGA